MFAIKMLLAEAGHSPHLGRMFMQEAGLAARIRHPHVAQVVDLGEDSGVLYQVMEWVDGVSLSTLMRIGPERFPIAIAARVIAQACLGLHAAHELREDDGAGLGLVHRDVSPQNILVTADGITKVIDFGVAHFNGQAAVATHAGTTRGKVPYMAPEHALGEPTDRRADVFGLGTVLYELLAGVHPFLVDDDLATLARIVSADEAPHLRAQGVDVSVQLDQVVASALMKAREARTETAGELFRGLARAVPAAALQSTDQAVGAFVQKYACTYLEERTTRLRSDLAKLDGPAPHDMTHLSLHHGDEASGVHGIAHTVDEEVSSIVPLRSKWSVRTAVALVVLSLGGAAWALFGKTSSPRLHRAESISLAHLRALRAGSVAAAQEVTPPSLGSIESAEVVEPEVPPRNEPETASSKLGAPKGQRARRSNERAPRAEFAPGGI
jgi:serine/threonine-protein kinase